MNMIEVENVSMKFRMANDKVISLKEYMVALLERRLQYKEFTALENINFNVNKGEVLGIIGKKWSWKKYFIKNNCWSFKNLQQER